MYTLGRRACARYDSLSSIPVLSWLSTSLSILLYPCHLKSSCDFDLVESDDRVALLEVGEASEANTALGTLAHFRDILLVVLECLNRAYSVSF